MWAQRTLDAHRPLLERLAESLGSSATALPDEGSDAGPEAAMTGWFTQLLQMLNPMMLATTAGSAIGHLARSSFGQYDLPVPRHGTDELLLVVPNIDEFGAEWSLPADDLRLWVCVHELAHHAVLGIPHVRARLDDLLTRFASAFSADPSALERRLEDIEVDPSDPSGMAELQRALGDPKLLLGAIQSPEQQAMRPQIDATVAIIVGYVDHVIDTVGERLIASHRMLTEAMHRRRVTATDADRFVERLFGLELTQTTYDRGEDFVAGVIERAGDAGLARLWEHERNLPTSAEVDAPGLWLARIDLPDE
jgi:putative hydrolase